MMIEVLKSKVRKAIVTNANLDYKGSIVLDQDYMDKAKLRAYQRVDINVKSNGNRFNTYVLPAERGSQKVEINGAASHMVKEGMIIHINAYGLIDDHEDFEPHIIETF